MDQNDLQVCMDPLIDSIELRARAEELCVKQNPDNTVGSLEMAIATHCKWKNGSTLRVRFLDGLPEVQARVAPIAQEWQNHANIRFVFVDDPDAEIRITFAGGGFSSYVGIQALAIPSDEPTMQLGGLKPDLPEWRYRRHILHEFGHALGCIHEHQSPGSGIKWNKPFVYDYYRNLPRPWHPNEVERNIFERYEGVLSQYVEWSAFDPESIMLYPIPKEFTTDGYSVDWNLELSDTDKAYMRRTYPFDQ